jgi:hypothetical protein
LLLFSQSDSVIKPKSTQTPSVTFYQQRQEYWLAQTAAAELHEGNVVKLRLLASAVFIGVCVWAYGFGGNYWALTLPLLCFAYLVVRHARITRLKQRAADGLTYAEHALSRFTNQWIGQGPTGNHASEQHPYAADLDLFGPGSLFDLLCTAATQGGQQQLAQWLLSPANAEVATDRQQAAQWLAPRAELREQMALLAAQHSESTTMPADVLAQWGQQTEHLLSKSRMAPIAAWGLTLSFVVAIGLWNLTELGPTPLLIQALIAWLVQHRYREPMRATLAGLDHAEKELALVAKLLERAEVELGEAPSSALLKELASKLGVSSSEQPSHAASVAIRDLKSRISWLEARSNQLVAPVAYLMGWSLHWACSIDNWRGLHGPQLASWLSALAQFEALNALAHFQFDRPHYARPHIIASLNSNLNSEAHFEGFALGHPLLLEEDCVTNDVVFSNGLQVMLVSGSNMSGKSTLMRTVGVNVVLALAGAVVCARGLQLSSLQLGATLRIQDSLQEGQSRFYAEITRLKQIVDLSKGDPPLLFLLDEVLSGTNSHDRQIGAQQIIEGLVAAGAIGFVTTHDLALAKIADALAPKARNLHFRDQMMDGEIQFDYRLHEGVVQHSNALELMRSIGLAVD